MGTPLTLKVYKGDELVATKSYDRDIIKIGRLASAHLCLDDEKVSRIHSVIEVGADGGLSIIDMGSVEGTYVNGKRVNKGVIAIGDEIKVGNTTIKVESGAADDSASVQPGEVTKIVRGEDVEAATIGSNAAATALHPTMASAPPAPPPPEEEEEAAPPPPPPEEEPAPARRSGKKAKREAAPVARPPPAPVPEVDEESVAPAGASAPRPAPARRRGSGPLGLELRFMWGDQMVASHFMQPGVAGTYSVGTGEGVSFAMGDSKLGAPKFDVVKADTGGFQLRFTGKMKGELTRRGETMDLRTVIESGKANHEGDAYALSLDAEDFAWVDLGAVTLEVFFQPVPKPVIVPLSESIDFTAMNIFLVMFFLASVAVVSFVNAVAEGDEYADELSGNQARIAKLIIKPPENRKNPLLEKLNQQKRSSGEMAAKHRGDEGQMGKRDAPKRSAHTAPKGDPNNKDQARMLTQKIFGSGGGGLSTVFGPNGLGGELKSAMGNMFGAAAGDAQGFGGLGLRGSGSGGGGQGDSIGIGGIGTKGRGGGTGSYGSGVGVLGGKKSVDVGITSSEPMVMGSLDKELIRQVIHRNRNQIRYCYESQLTRFPKLKGKVAVKFVISASGSVASSSVAQADTNNAELETCVAGRVRTWMFPKPKGGGVVIVTYPFIFKASGE